MSEEKYSRQFPQKVTSSSEIQSQNCKIIFPSISPLKIAYSSKPEFNFKIFNEKSLKIKFNL